MQYLTTQQVAVMLHTNASTIRKSRVTGMLYDVPAPLFKRLGKSKILYLESEVHKFMDAVPDSRVITLAVKPPRMLVNQSVIRLDA